MICGKEAPHGVLVKLMQIAGIELLIVGLEKLLYDGLAELSVKHIQKIGIFGFFLALEQVI